MGKSTNFSSIIKKLKDIAKTMKPVDIARYYGLNERKFVDLNYDNFRKKLELFTRLEDSEVT